MPLMRKLKMRWRSLSAFAHDICAAALAWWFAYELRFNFDIPPHFTESLLHVVDEVEEKEG